MWIRSQDKESLINCDLVYTEDSWDYEENGYSIYSELDPVLGRYKTKERCIEVINEIQSHIDQKREYVFEMPEQ